MRTTLPLTTFRATVKFMRTTFLNELGRQVMERSFPMFLAHGGGLSRHARETLAAARRDGSVGQAFGLAQVRRRYAGGVSLPRGSYYAVCNDASGNDHGTLARELLAYVRASDADHVRIEDLVMPDDREALQAHCQAPAGLRLLLPRPPGSENPIVEALVASGLMPALPPGTGFAVYLPLDLRQIEVPDVLDLRQQAAQQWLAGFLPRGNDLFSMPFAGPVASFPEMLPDLMNPDRGGSDLDKGIGNLLRRAGVQGLVFPSARSDVLCEFNQGELSDFRGWNFLDYRDAPPDSMLERMVFQHDWMASFGQARVHLAPDDSPFAGSWRVSGHEAQMRRELALRPDDSLDAIAYLREAPPAAS